MFVKKAVLLIADTNIWNQSPCNSSANKKPRGKGEKAETVLEENTTYSDLPAGQRGELAVHTWSRSTGADIRTLLPPPVKRYVILPQLVKLISFNSVQHFIHPSIAELAFLTRLFSWLGFFHGDNKTPIYVMNVQIENVIGMGPSIFRGLLAQHESNIKVDEIKLRLYVYLTRRIKVSQSTS